MALELTLYQIEDDLLSLLDIRDEAANENDIDALKAIDEQLVEYAKAEVRKADGIAHHWRNFEARVAAKKAESKRLAAEARLDEERLDRLKSMVQFAMESFEWRAGKPRVIEGKTCKLYLKRNGGRPAVEISDESLVPDEFCTVTVAMNAISWAILARDDVYGPALSKVRALRAPSLTLIAEQLSRNCEACGGDGNFDCPECGGTGKQSVPGARFAPVGQHVECR